MRSKALFVTIVGVLAGTAYWVACNSAAQPESVTATTPVAEETSSSGHLAEVRARQLAYPERPEPGSSADRQRLEQRVRIRFEQRREAWIAQGKPDQFIAFMEQALERRIHDIRTRPPTWFTTEAIKERVRERNEAAAQLFLDNGYSPEEVEALVGEKGR